MKSGLGEIFLKFLHALTMSFSILNFDQKYKFSNKNGMVSAWRNFRNIFSRPHLTIIFRSEMLRFHPYSILTGDTMVGFVIFCVLKFTKTQSLFTLLCTKLIQNPSRENREEGHSYQRVLKVPFMGLQCSLQTMHTLLFQNILT